MLKCVDLLASSGPGRFTRVHLSRQSRSCPPVGAKRLLVTSALSTRNPKSDLIARTPVFSVYFLKNSDEGVKTGEAQ